MMKNKLPNFLIVGAAKSGTSSLHNYLNQHPDVFMPSYNEKGMKVKEPRFLIKNLVENRLHNGVWSWEEYQNLFNKVKSEKMIGESTVLYLYYYKEAIKNIKKYLGEDVKIIIMLRHPVDRAFSAYTHVARGLKENLTFEEALAVENKRLINDVSLSPMVMYKDMGLYYDMVKSYLDNFENVHVIIYEDFKNQTKEVVRNLLDFLDVESKIRLDMFAKYNVGGKRWVNPFFKQIFMQDNFIKKFFRKKMPFRLRKKIRIIIELIFKKNIQLMNKGTRKQLIDFYSEDILKLENLLKVNLENWKR